MDCRMCFFWPPEYLSIFIALALARNTVYKKINSQYVTTRFLHQDIHIYIYIWQNNDFFHIFISYFHPSSFFPSLSLSSQIFKIYFLIPQYLVETSPLVNMKKNMHPWPEFWRAPLWRGMVSEMILPRAVVVLPSLPADRTRPLPGCFGPML